MPNLSPQQIPRGFQRAQISCIHNIFKESTWFIFPSFEKLQLHFPFCFQFLKDHISASADGWMFSYNSHGLCSASPSSAFQLENLNLTFSCPVFCLGGTISHSEAGFLGQMIFLLTWSLDSRKPVNVLWSGSKSNLTNLLDLRPK